jgi:hypothetical protein
MALVAKVLAGEDWCELLGLNGDESRTCAALRQKLERP